MLTGHLFLASVAITVISLGLGTWLVFVRHSRSTLAYIAFGSGLSLSVLCVLVFGSYRWEFLRPLNGTWAPALLALAVYATVVVIHLRAHRLAMTSTLLGIALSLVPLAVIGLVLLLMIACASGDCI